MKHKPIEKAVVAVLLSVLLTPAAGRAEDASLQRVLDAHCRARANIVSLEAGFVQTRIFTLFDETETSRGEFLYSQPDKIGWFYTEPDRSSTVINGEAGWTVLPHIRQIQKFRLEGSKTNRVLAIVGFGRCETPLTESFDVSLADGDDGYHTLVLKPTDETITPYFDRIDLFLDRGDFLPRKIELHEKSGDTMVFEFSHLDKNADIAPETFEYAVPEGYTVVEY